MAISSDDLLRLVGRSGVGPTQGTPSYETLNQISQQHQTTPKKSNTVIPARFQGGGVADDTSWWHNFNAWRGSGGESAGGEAAAPSYRGGGVQPEGGLNPREFGGTPSDFNRNYSWNSGNPTGPENYNPNIEPPQLPSQTDPTVDQPMGNFYDFGNFDPGVPQFYPNPPMLYQDALVSDVNPNFNAMLHMGQDTKPHARGGVIKRYQGGGVPTPTPSPNPSEHQYDPQPVPLYRGFPAHRFDPRFSRAQYQLMAEDGGVAKERSQSELDQLSPRQQEIAYRHAVTAMMPYFQDAVMRVAQPARPIYTADMLSRPPQQLSGYYGEMGDYQQAPPAEQEPQYAQPIYTADMLEKPPSKLSGYYGELSGGYQEGGIVDPKTGHVARNYAGEGAGAYNYVDPRAAAPVPAPQMAQRSQEMNAAAANMADYIRQALMHEEVASAIKGMDAVGGALYQTKNKEAGMVPEGETPNFQEGGVANPLETLGFQPPSQQQQQQQQAEQKKKVAPKPQAQGPQRPYEFGPANYFFNAPALLKAIERQKAMTEGEGAEPGMKEGGVIPKEFMNYLANGGLVKEFTPDHHLMFALGAKYALSPRQAAKGLDTVSRSNPMPP